MSKVPRSAADLNRLYQRQMSALLDSCESYDVGRLHEAPRIAALLRLMLHTGKNSKPLLGQVGKLDRKFVSLAAPYVEDSITSYSGLIVYQSDPRGGWSFLPWLDDMNQEMLPFEEWWAAPAFRTDDRQIITRKELVLTMAEQDGGVHVDPAVNANYASLNSAKGLGFLFSPSPFGQQTKATPQEASVRQIGHEVLRTMNPLYRKQMPKSDVGMMFGGIVISTSSTLGIAELSGSSSRSPVTPPPDVARNAPCPCGSDQKFKRCCGRQP